MLRKDFQAAIEPQNQGKDTLIPPHAGALKLNNETTIFNNHNCFVS